MTRDDLEKYRDNKKWVEELLEEYESKLERIKRLGQVISDMPKAQNKPNYEHEKLMDDYKEMLEVAHQKQKHLNAIVHQLNKINPFYANILFKIYVKGKPLGVVADEINYSYNKVCTYKGLALIEFDKLDEKNQCG